MKSKKIVWHKKKGKIISSSALKSHGANPRSKEDEALHSHINDRRKAFARKLLEQIRKAVK